MDFFQAGQKIGKANAPSSSGVDNVLDMFKTQAENKMKLQQTAALFKGEEQYKNQNDPTRVDAANRVASNSNFLGGGQSNPMGGQPQQTPSQPSWNEVTEQAKLSSLVAGNPDKKDALMARFNQRKNEAMSGVSSQGSQPGNPFASQTPSGTIQTGADIYGRKFTDLDAVAKEEEVKQRTQQAAQVEPLIGTTIGVLKGGVGRFKAMANANPAGAGRLAGPLNWLGGKTGSNPNVKPYEGLKVEIATELAKIANPSGRGAQATIDEFMKLLPDNFSTWDEAGNKIHDAAQNAFARYHGYKYGTSVPYDPAKYEPYIQDILNAPASKEYSLNPIQKAAAKNGK